MYNRNPNLIVKVLYWIHLTVVNSTDSPNVCRFVVEQEFGNIWGYFHLFYLEQLRL